MDYIFKTLIIGDSAAGKSSLLLRYADKTFNPIFHSTIGVDYRIKTVQFQNQTIKLQIWDTAGQEKFENIVQSYYRGANGVLLVFDLSVEDALSGVEKWMLRADHNVSEKTVKILVGNKSDLPQLVKQEDIDAMIKKYSIKYFKTSSLNGEGIDEVFQEGMLQMMNANKKEVVKAAVVKPMIEEEKSKFSCC